MSARPEFNFTATPRAEMGKAAVRRLRRENKVPGIIYGAEHSPMPITLDHKDLKKALSHEAVFSHILTIKVGNKSEKVVLKALERDPIKPVIKHIDFQRIRAGEKLIMNIPLHFLGAEEAPGVKEGGILSYTVKELEVKCLPDDLPEYIEVDITNLAIDEAVHLSDIKLPKGVELTTEVDEKHDATVVSIHHARVEAESEEEASATEAVGGEEAAATAEGEKTEE